MSPTHDRCRAAVEHRFMKKAVHAALLGFFVASAHAQPWNWTEHAHPEDGFAVEFNGMVTVKPMKLADAASRIERGTQYVQSDRLQLYSVAASLNRAGVNLAEGALRGFAGLACGKTLAENAIRMPWGDGLELRGENCVDGTYEAEARYHRVGRWFYQVVALYKRRGGDAESARRFLDSFRVTR
jgi:hypothetical protein